MFGSTVLEVAFGIVFCYAALALTVSSLQEAIASMLQWRARLLWASIQRLLKDPELARRLYQHALVNPQGGRPSYIDPKHFAEALLEVVKSVDTIQDPALRELLQGLIKKTEGDALRLRDELARWFDTAMERVSGTYKRHAQAMSVLLSFILAALFNIDSVHLFQTLWTHPALVAGFDAANPQLAVLPIGWQVFPPVDIEHFLLQVAGWLLTASSALFGAPFWFDLLQKLVRVRGTGVKPAAEGA